MENERPVGRFFAPLAILSALPDEQRGLVDQLTHPRQQMRAGRSFWCGELAGVPVVLATSGIGKVAASITTLVLIEALGVGRVVFTGVAGGVGPGVAVGDVVVGTAFVQHDMDCSPLFPRYEIPLSGRSLLPADAALSASLLQACHASELSGHRDSAPELSTSAVQVHSGLIASGDRFVSKSGEAAALLAALAQAGHYPLAVEMECAAVAQVCGDYQIPFAAVRTISDRADAQAHGDFQAFVTQVASVYTQRIIGQLLPLLQK
ncbi:MAG: 5'-methylthioadenosine/S-adenosylhomocysteine nucleosidase [Burkholderiales bacterium PBB3]|nr:MAG: 5'-methylthioadenosine/S-adenosylhomocysteine nucleosidase [Burkholderiales bacterium PBB3]